MITALGLMSGTSLDGVDAAIIKTNGENIGEFGPFLTLEYPAEFKLSVKELMAGQGNALAVEKELTLWHAQAVKEIIGNNEPPEIIGFHGQTIWHKPEQGQTWQIGDGSFLANLTQISGVNDFRSHDVKNGGQGAPLVPVFHQALARNLPKPLIFLNLGGVGNITYIGPNQELIAFDTGPGNALLDDWVLKHTGKSCDYNGFLSQNGQIDTLVIERFNDLAYFRLLPPKSLDRNQFHSFALDALAGLNPTDGAATLAALTVQSVVLALPHLPKKPELCLVCGGGRHNPVIMDSLRQALKIPVQPVEKMGFNGDAIEAQAFAFLAVRSLKKLPLSFPSTTGVKTPLSGGKLHFGVTMQK